MATTLWQNLRGVDISIPNPFFSFRYLSLYKTLPIMKNPSLFLLFLLICINASAQSWAPAGATWNYQYFPMQAYGREEIKRTGDTSIDSHVTVTLTRTAVYQYKSGPGPNDFDIDTAVLGKEYMYEDNGKVFWYHDSSFRQLYDLNAQVGDTLVIPGVADFGPVCDTIGQVRVDSSGNATINGLSLMYIVVSPLPSSVWAYRGRIYERIGPVSYMFPTLDSPCVTDWNQLGPLRCYSDDNFTVAKFATVPCDFVVGLGEAKEPARIGIFPNPAHNKISLTGIADISSLVVCDMTGRAVPASTYQAAEKFIDITSLPAGFYLLRVVDAQGNNSVGRFIKN
jgi:hypothetical protein